MQAWRMIPEIYLVHPKSQLKAVVRDAIDRGMRLIVVGGGDGTIDSVVDALVGTEARLGIVPTGTRNNVAASLDIPVGNIPEAVAILRRGRSLRVDVGFAYSRHSRRHFFEAASVGLISALFPAADDIQHGNLARIGDLLTTLVGMPVAELRLKLDDGAQKIVTQGHVVLIGNMPFFATNLRISQDVSFVDGLLDVFVFSNLTKLELLGYAVQVISGAPTDPRVQHFQVRNLEVRSLPRMPVMVDGFMLEEGPLRVCVRRHALAVMAAQTALAKLSAQPPVSVEEETDAN